MERELVLSSYYVKDVNNNKPEDFRRKLSRTISLDSNQGYNIGFESNNNNQLKKCSNDNGNTFNGINFASGVWAWTEISNEITVIDNCNYKRWRRR